MIRAAPASDVPVIPDGPTAQDWALEELSRPIYRDGESLLAMLIGWVREFLDQLLEAAAEANVPAWLLLAVLGTAAGLAAWRFVGVPLRQNQHRAEPLFADPARSAASFRAEADAAAADGRYVAAVLARFRAIVRDLEERAILDESPGRTAREAGIEAGRVLPQQAAGLTDAARLFDRVAYGRATAGPGDEAGLRELDGAIRAARPAG